jgi:CBS domain-containing protein
MDVGAVMKKEVVFISEDATLEDACHPASR